MMNRTIDCIAALVFVAAFVVACASPNPDAYQRALDCPLYDCGEE